MNRFNSSGTPDQWWNDHSGASLEQASNAPSVNGWKIHLNFDPTNIKHIEKMNSELTQLKNEGNIAGFKIAYGGGCKVGNFGKEATVYVGHFDLLDNVAQSLVNRVGDILLESDPTTINQLCNNIGVDFISNLNSPYFGIDVLHDDIPVLVGNNKILARYYTPDFNFHQYGRDGVPWLNNDMNPWNRSDPKTSAANALKRLCTSDSSGGETFFGRQGEVKFGNWYAKRLAQKLDFVASFTVQTASVDLPPI